MSQPVFEEFAIEFEPVALNTDENKKVATVPAGHVVESVTMRVLRAGDGDQYLSVGSTLGGSDLMSTANAGATALGIKVGGIGNRVGYTAAGNLFVNYGGTTGTIKPKARIGWLLRKLPV